MEAGQMRIWAKARIKGVLQTNPTSWTCGKARIKESFQQLPLRNETVAIWSDKFLFTPKQDWTPDQELPEPAGRQSLEGI